MTEGMTFGMIISILLDKLLQLIIIEAVQKVVKYTMCHAELVSASNKIKRL